ncbi:MAG TPA: tetratricopeptide repeat protein [Tepidisphaeraceae bacterium]|nr:tetratricopeptide repeat protein [Tepidisphaeraceae bacterium]
MKSLLTINPLEFVQAVEPLLESRDLSGLLSLIKSRWTAEQIVEILTCSQEDARKVASLALSLVGCNHCLPALAKQLKDPDPMVNQLAEHAMWSIWFRGGSAEANHQVCRGAEAIGRGDHEHAILHFNKALQINPKFSEAYNQRAIAHFLLERYDASILDCETAVELMPIHFGAWAGMGHCHAHQGEFCKAVEFYRRALSINPHMAQIREAIDQLKSQINVV